MEHSPVYKKEHNNIKKRPMETTLSGHKKYLFEIRKYNWSITNKLALFVQSSGLVSYFYELVSETTLLPSSYLNLSLFSLVWTVLMHNHLIRCYETQHRSNLNFSFLSSVVLRRPNLKNNLPFRADQDTP